MQEDELISPVTSFSKSFYSICEHLPALSNTPMKQLHNAVHGLL